VAELIAHLQDVVQSLVGGLRGVSRRRVLASDGWFVGGALFTLVSRQARIVVKVPDGGVQDELLALDGAQMWQIGKKAPMRAWIQLPEALHDDEEALKAWLERAWTLNSAGPPRPSKRRAPSRTRPRTRTRASRPRAHR
jgi:TfoX/Sxy family transcriptional regulator of competence genes